jgi:hypothetical protein
MKKIITLLALISTLFTFAQVPQGISYQAIALNGSGNPVVSSNIGVRISVLDNTATGTVLYTETHTPTTNAQGLYNLVIGQGTPTTGTFSTINWGTNSKFLKVEMDVVGGTNYVLVGTTQLLSVPYALYAGKVDAENVVGGTNDANTFSMSFMTTTDAHLFFVTSTNLLAPYNWTSIPITGTPMMKSYNTFVTSSNIYSYVRVGSNYQWISSAISGQPLKVYATVPGASPTVITTTNAYVYNALSQTYVSVNLQGTLVDAYANCVLTTTYAYVYAPDDSQSSYSWHSIPILGTPIKVKTGNLDSGSSAMFLTSTNAYVYGPDSTSAGPTPVVPFSWKTISLGSAPVLD